MLNRGDYMEWVLIMISVMAIIVALAVIFVWKMNKKGWKQETDYRTIFYMGLIWFPMGLILDMQFFFII